MGRLYRVHIYSGKAEVPLRTKQGRYGTRTSTVVVLVVIFRAPVPAVGESHPFTSAVAVIRSYHRGKINGRLLSWAFTGLSNLHTFGPSVKIRVRPQSYLGLLNPIDRRSRITS